MPNRPRQMVRCRVFGHRAANGYTGKRGTKYLAFGRTVARDGMGIFHVPLETECARCGTPFTVGLIHMRYDPCAALT